jgi:argininosuccinate lyase
LSEKFPAQGYKDNVLADCFADAKRYFLDHYLAVDRAHAIMLAEQGIITAAEQRDILQSIENLDLDSIRSSEYDGSVEDLFCYLQREITAGCDDSEAGGKLHTARSRNDIDVTIYRLYLREQTLDLIDACTGLHRVLIDLAGQHHESLMPAYTHTQPAQPTTIAHYLLSMAENTGRDVRRLQRAYDNMNRCPLGACAITTSGFPIDRERVSTLLGFDGPTGNSYASIASVDYFIELLGAGAALMINTGKFAQEFLLMAMMEFGVIRLPDGYVQASSIMPQKRNPVAVEHVRAIASKALGQMLGVMTAVHNTPFGDINDVEDDLQPLNFSAVRDAIRAVSLLANTLSAAEFDIELLAKRAEENFITVTELADTLVRTDNLSFSAAHAIVADCVAAATDADSAITHDMLQAAASSKIGRDLEMTSEELGVALSAENFVQVRDIIGGPAPARTRTALTEQLDHVKSDQTWTENARNRLQLGRQKQADAIVAATQ